MTTERDGLVCRQHELKCWPKFFELVFTGVKTFELRKNDRDYRVGDELWIREWTNFGDTYTGRECWRVVTHILRAEDTQWDADVLAPGYVVMAMIESKAADALSAAQRLIEQWRATARDHRQSTGGDGREGDDAVTIPRKNRSAEATHRTEAGARLHRRVRAEGLRPEPPLRQVQRRPDAQAAVAAASSSPRAPRIGRRTRRITVGGLGGRDPPGRVTWISSGGRGSRRRGSARTGHR